MNNFLIDTETSYGAVAMLRLLASAPDITFRSAILNVKNVPTDSQKPMDWPLAFECFSSDPDNREFKIRIHMLTCGYQGSGPRDLIECLKIAGFGKIIDQEQIYTEKEIKRIYYL